MRQMNDGANSKEKQEFVRLVGNKVESQELARQTPEAEQSAKACDELSKRILGVIDEADSIEDLIYCEMVLQTLDRLSATSQRDKNSIENAQKEYRQLSETITQMRENPDEYFRANKALKGTDGDFRKLPRGRIQHIYSNVSRMQNRAAFATNEERKVWDARIKLAEKTVDMLRAMHKALVKEYESRYFPE